MFHKSTVYTTNSLSHVMVLNGFVYGHVASNTRKQNHMTDNYISKVEINLFNGVFKETIEFNKGLNLITGENGTGKTQLLTHIKNFIGHVNQPAGHNQPNQPIKIYVTKTGNVHTRLTAFSPKRNATKQAVSQTIQAIRQQGIDINKLDQQLLQAQFQDTNFTSYRSFGEYFIVMVEDLVREGTQTYENAVEAIRLDFEKIVKRVFPEYSLKAQWLNKNPHVALVKNGHQEIQINQLSCGENEVLSMIFNIYGSRDKFDYFLIDEPEQHLNWRLENGLFNFFKWFCNEFNKQIIITTHSRAVFQQDFIDNCIFLKWENQNIVCKKELDESVRLAVAGDAIQIINGLTLADKICFVEDKSHELVFNKIAELEGKDIDVRIENGRANVEKLFKTLKNENIHNCLFIVDHDNKVCNSEYLSSGNFIQLSKYCIENYFFELDLLQKISGGKQGIDNLIKQAIKDCKDSAFLVYHKLIDNGIPIDDSLLASCDGSAVLKKLAPKLGYDKHYDLMSRYMEQAKADGKLEIVFREILNKL